MTSSTKFIGAALLVFAIACTDAEPPTIPEPVAAVTVTPDRRDLRVGEEARFTARLSDRAGRELQGRVVRWTSSAPAVATVSAEGVASARSLGTATITATSEGKSSTSEVRVTDQVVVTYELMHSGWIDYPKGELRLFAVPLSGGASRILLAADVLPDLGVTQVAASPDGGRIAFTAYHPTEPTSSIYVANADGSAVRQLTNGRHDSQPTWSRDGTRIAYVVRPPGGKGDIWVINADGTGATNLTGGANDFHQYSPSWSRVQGEGERIAFGEGDSYHSNLWTMRPDGSDRRRVTEGREWWDDEPSWSPDGTRLVFQRAGPGTESYDLWIVDANGANARSHVKLPAAQVVPDWSPDGTLIAFNSAHAEDPEDWFVIYTVRGDGTGLQRRTFDPAMVLRPAWRRRQ